MFHWHIKMLRMTEITTSLGDDRRAFSRFLLYFTDRMNLVFENILKNSRSTERENENEQNSGTSHSTFFY